MTQGPIDHGDMEVSVSPRVDCYPWGFFSGGLVFTASQRTSVPSPVSPNALGRALAPGTCCWHAGGYDGALGGLGTAWWAVRSFTVHSTSASARRIGVDPASLTFWVKQGDPARHVSAVDISNTGGGTFFVTASRPPSETWWAFGTLTDTGQVAMLRLGAQPVNGLRYKAFTCSLPVGAYRFDVDATDGAGNTQAKVGSNTLTVR